MAGTKELADDVAAVDAVKPVHAYLEDAGASAAYWIASQARTVTANAMAMVGSLGTFTVLYDLSKSAEMDGVQGAGVVTGVSPNVAQGEANDQADNSGNGGLAPRAGGRLVKIDQKTPIWVVTDPTSHSALPDICFATDLDGMRLQFAGGLPVTPSLRARRDAARARSRALRDWLDHLSGADGPRSAPRRGSRAQSSRGYGSRRHGGQDFAVTYMVERDASAPGPPVPPPPPRRDGELQSSAGFPRRPFALVRSCASRGSPGRVVHPAK